MFPASDSARLTIDFTLRLCALLRQRGVTVGAQQTTACVEAIALFAVIREEELKRIYRITLINRREDLWRLHRAYELLMRGLAPEGEAEDDPRRPPRLSPIRGATQQKYSLLGAPPGPSHESAAVQGYSTAEVNQFRDLRLLTLEETGAALAELKKVARRHATLLRRKLKRSRRRGQLDLRASLRAAVRHEGELIQWRYRRKRPSHVRLAVVADVSGSMDIYSLFLLSFLHLLNSARVLRVNTFVFSTRLEDLSRPFRSRRFPDVLRNIALHFPAWSGGTKIGAALQQLNESHEGAITPKTTVIIMSDGWDTGDAALLDREMATLRRRARSIIWLNPLKGDPDYEPLATGMSTALPHCDQFITGHSIESLAGVARLLRL
jgi:uncharacterized protein